MNRRLFIKSVVIAASATLVTPVVLDRPDRLELTDGCVQADAEKLAKLCGLIYMPKPVAMSNGKRIVAKSRMLRVKVDPNLRFLYYDHLSDYLKADININRSSHLHGLCIYPSFEGMNRYIVARTVQRPFRTI